VAAVLHFAPQRSGSRVRAAAVERREIMLAFIRAIHRSIVQHQVFHGRRQGGGTPCLKALAKRVDFTQTRRIYIPRPGLPARVIMQGL